MSFSLYLKFSIVLFFSFCLTDFGTAKVLNLGPIQCIQALQLKLKISFKKIASLSPPTKKDKSVQGHDQVAIPQKEDSELDSTSSQSKLKTSNYPTSEVPLLVNYDLKLNQIETTYLIKSIIDSDDFTITILRTENRIAPLPIDFRLAEKQEDNSSNINYFFDSILPLVIRANKKFEDRRGWGEVELSEKGISNTFSEKNIKVAKKFLLNSSYVLIRLKTTKELIGGIRNIQLLDDGKSTLPEEDYLDIKVPDLGLSEVDANVIQWKNEIGTYYIEESLSPDLRQKVFFSIWTQLHRFLFSKGNIKDNRYNQSFHTYGDRTSLRLYQSLGFQKLRIYQHEGEWKDYTHLPEDQIPSLLPKGETNPTKGWWPMVLLPKGFIETNEKMSISGLSKAKNPWIEDNRRQLTNLDQGLLQLGALFNQLMNDLKSTNKTIFRSAVSGIIEVIESVSDHYEIALATRPDVEVNNQSIDEIIKLRTKIENFFEQLKPTLSDMPDSSRIEMSHFLGRILHFSNLGSNQYSKLLFLENGIIPLLSDSNSKVSYEMTKQLKNIYTAKKWLTETQAVLDLPILEKNSFGQWVVTQESQNEFYDDVKEYKIRMNYKLRDLGLAQTDINNFIDKIQILLFTPSQEKSLSGIAFPDKLKQKILEPDFMTFVNLNELLKSKHNKINLEFLTFELILLAAAKDYLDNPDYK